MENKNMLKVKSIGEERYFRDERELIRFIEKQGGQTWGKMSDLYSNLAFKEDRVAARYWKTHMDLNRDKLIIGKFIFRIFRGPFHMTSGTYEFNVIAEARADLLCGREINEIFEID